MGFFGDDSASIASKFARIRPQLRPEFGLVGHVNAVTPHAFPRRLYAFRTEQLGCTIEVAAGVLAVRTSQCLLLSPKQPALRFRFYRSRSVSENVQPDAPAPTISPPLKPTHARFHRYLFACKHAIDAVAPLDVCGDVFIHETDAIDDQVPLLS